MQQIELSLIETEKPSLTRQMSTTQQAERQSLEVRSVIALVDTKGESEAPPLKATPIGATTKSVEQVIREFRQSGEVSFITYLRSLDEE